MSPRFRDVLFIFLRLGLTSFGGPTAHLGYFHQEFVVRRRWLQESEYADLVALCQALPGPASSQVALGIGLSVRGLSGAVAAWLGFTIPSALLMMGFAAGFFHLEGTVREDLGRGLQLAAIAIVAWATFSMARKLVHGPFRWTIAVIATLTALFLTGPLTATLILVAAAVAGGFFLKAPAQTAEFPRKIAIPWFVVAGSLGLFTLLLFGLPLLNATVSISGLQIFERFFRVGALVFGGGHVILPLLQTEVVARGWVNAADFSAGYGAVQAVPGPLFTFAAYLGMILKIQPNGVAGAALCLVAIFLPSFLLIFGALPIWNQLRGHAAFRGSLQSVNAAVTGLLLAAWIQLVRLTEGMRPREAILILVAFAALASGKCPPWVLVLACALAGLFLL
jgi:chromate transporter